jgi:hypothetical protein
MIGYKLSRFSILHYFQEIILEVVMIIKRFEELKVWQDARMLTKSIYSITSTGKFSKDYGLRDQFSVQVFQQCQIL